MEENLQNQPMNKNIQTARDIALSILKPTQRDLEHGLELHKNACVIESYGLGLYSPVDPDVVNAAIDAGASDRELQDLIEDMSMTRWVATPELREEYLEAWEASGVTCTFQNAGEEGNDPLRLLKRLARHTYVTAAMPSILQRAFTPSDIESAHQNGKHCAYLTCNGIPLGGDQTNPSEELRYIRVFAQLGARMMHLTYNRRNPIGDGCAEPGNAGMSDFGHAVVKEMNRLGVIIDVAHTGWQTCLDAAKASTQPIVVSHSTACAINHHVRGKPDNVIRAVLDTGGSMGITNVPAFLGGTGDISAFLDHIDYVAKTFGTDHLTIGTDQEYTSRDIPETWQKIKSLGKQRDRWEYLWPTNDPVHSPEWHQDRQIQSLRWTNWPLFTVGLVQRGYTDGDILKIIGGNILRVAQTVWSQSCYAV
jgi:membrane dipeptidase